MQSVVVFFCICSLVFCNPVHQEEIENLSSNVTHFLVEVSPGIYVNQDLTVVPPKINVSNSDVKIFFFSRATSSGVEVDVTNARAVAGTDFSTSRNTIFVVHGWQNNHISPVCEDVRKGYLAVMDANVFIVDWSKIAKFDYIVSQASVEQIGKIVGTLINDLVKNERMSLDKTAIVGHSLGAHIAGVAGAAVGGDLDHIVGLDPAGPLFSIGNRNNRLDKSDAKFVQVVHTCSDLLGFSSALGHADYWPNNGKEQPGCHDITGSCSHGRSYLYFTESLTGGHFVSRRCDSYALYEKGSCNNNPSSLMGQANIDKSASGNYYLNTNSASPFAKG